VKEKRAAIRREGGAIIKEKERTIIKRGRRESFY